MMPIPRPARMLALVFWYRQLLRLLPLLVKAERRGKRTNAIDSLGRQRHRLSPCQSQQDPAPRHSIQLINRLGGRFALHKVDKAQQTRAARSGSLQFGLTSSYMSAYEQPGMGKREIAERLTPHDLDGAYWAALCKEFAKALLCNIAWKICLTVSSTQSFIGMGSVAPTIMTFVD